MQDDFSSLFTNYPCKIKNDFYTEWIQGEYDER